MKECRTNLMLCMWKKYNYKHKFFSMNESANLLELEEELTVQMFCNTSVTAGELLLIRNFYFFIFLINNLRSSTKIRVALC